MNLNKQYIDHGVKWGLIQFLIVGVVFYIIYVINIEFAVGTGRWITIPFSIALLIIQGAQARRFRNGGLKYGDAFKTLFIAGIVSSALMLTTDFIVKTASPSLAEQEKNITIEQTAKRMEDWGMEDDKIDEAIDRMQMQDSKPKITNTLLGLVFAAIFSAILALIVALVVKKKVKEEEIIIEEETT